MTIVINANDSCKSAQQLIKCGTVVKSMLKHGSANAFFDSCIDRNQSSFDEGHRMRFRI